MTNFQFSIFNFQKNRQGFALLIAVILATIILTTGLSIANTALKEIILAATVRSSLSSFYIADGGAECALYWDNIRGNFDKQSAFIEGSKQVQIECGGYVVRPNPTGSSVNFWLQDPDNLSLPCTNIDISTSPGDEDSEKVFLDSWGFNTCDINNSKRVDRAIEVKYSRFK